MFFIFFADTSGYFFRDVFSGTCVQNYVQVLCHERTFALSVVFIEFSLPSPRYFIGGGWGWQKLLDVVCCPSIMCFRSKCY